MIRPPLGMRQPQQPPQQPNYVQGGPPAPQGAGGGMMKQMAMMGAKTALAGSPLAPVAGLLGGFNEGGQVNRFGRKVTKPARTKTSSQGGGFWGKLFQKKNMGGPIAQSPMMYNKGGEVNRFGRKITKPARTKTSGQGGGFWGKLFQKKNMGGMIGPLANPHGYNEGGAVTETPIKKVMDEQKLDQQAVAFERDQARKQEAHAMAMKQKQQQFQMAQKMKKEAAVTSKKPKAPLAKK